MQKPAFFANLTRAIGLPSRVKMKSKDRFSFHLEQDAGNPSGWSLPRAGDISEFIPL
jgi:hypothetical protein